MVSSEVRSLGLDVGDKRTGVAMSDARGILATPLTVLASIGESALTEQVLKLVEQHKVERVVVGLPRRLSGDLGKQAGKVILPRNCRAWRRKGVSTSLIYDYGMNDFLPRLPSG